MLWITPLYYIYFIRGHKDNFLALEPNVTPGYIAFGVVVISVSFVINELDSGFIFSVEIGVKILHPKSVHSWPLQLQSQDLRSASRGDPGGVSDLLVQIR